MVEKTFHVSKACVEPSTLEEGKVTSVFLEVDGDEYILCNLNQQSLNQSLDLNFSAGEKLCFRVEVALVLTIHMSSFYSVHSLAGRSHCPFDRLFDGGRGRRDGNDAWHG